MTIPPQGPNDQGWDIDVVIPPNDTLLSIQLLPEQGTVLNLGVDQGVDEITLALGAEGPRGPAGPEGGPTGPTGPTGAVGVAGPTGPVGSASGAAGGDLTGTYPNPQIAAGVITDADVNAANKDGLTTKASMRTIGTGAQQAAGGDHGHTADRALDKLYVQSRGMNLVSNGYALMGDTTNFSQWTLHTADSPGGGGAFKRVPAGVAVTLFNDELIPVDPYKTYQLTVLVKQLGASTTARFYYGLGVWDVEGLIMQPYHYMYLPGTLTTLAAPLNPNDTTVTLTSATNWYNAGVASQKNITFWDYVDGKGKAWAPETYSRNVWFETAGKWASGGITGNVITLTNPYTGPAKAAGTPVSNGIGGGTYKYVVASNATAPMVWTPFKGFIGGIDTTGSGATALFPWGCAFVKLLCLINRANGGGSDAASDQAFGLLWMSEVDTANLRDLSIHDGKIAAANKDGLAAVPSMRTLGAGAQQAAAGNHTHVGSVLQAPDGSQWRLAVSNTGVLSTTPV